MTNCCIKDCAELSTCSSPTGISTAFTDIVNYMNDLYGSNTPLPRFIKLNLTISLLTHCLFEVIGSKFHSLKIFGNPFGNMDGYEIYEGSRVYIIKYIYIISIIIKHPLLVRVQLVFRFFFFCFEMIHKK